MYDVVVLVTQANYKNYIIVTGLAFFTKTVIYISKLAGNFYILGDTEKKLQMFNKIYNSFATQYMHDLIPYYSKYNNLPITQWQQSNIPPL